MCWKRKLETSVNCFKTTAALRILMLLDIVGVTWNNEKCDPINVIFLFNRFYEFWLVYITHISFRNNTEMTNSTYNTFKVFVSAFKTCIGTICHVMHYFIQNWICKFVYLFTTLMMTWVECLIILLFLGRFKIHLYFIV